MPGDRLPSQKRQCRVDDGNDATGNGFGEITEYRSAGMINERLGAALAHCPSGPGRNVPAKK